MRPEPRQHNETYTQEVARIRRMKPEHRSARDDVILWQADEIERLKSERAAAITEVNRLRELIADVADSPEGWGHDRIDEEVEKQQ